MLKKIISTSILSISALAVMTANAAAISDTAKTSDVKTIKAKKHHKPTQAVSSVERKSKPAVNVVDENNQPISQGISFARSGLPAGLYVSGQVGYAETHMNSKLPSPVGVDLANNGLAGRLAMGYKINQNFAIEVGYLQLQQGKAIGKDDTAYNKQNAIDIAGKGTIPLTHNVNLYGKVGVAYLTTRLEDKLAQDGNSVTLDNNNLYGIAKHKWAPEVAVGMGYDITPNVTVDTSFTHIQPMGSKRPGNIDFLAVGVGYNFG